jgi:hypothetical protein
VSSVFELVCGLALSAAAVFLVLRPIFSPSLAGPQTADDSGDDPDDDLSPRAVALRALKEIEFDRATGKLADGDYDALKRKYTAEALAALRDEPAGTPVLEARPAKRAATAPAAASCPVHGARPERDARFCSECGRQLTAAPSYCARCGNPLSTVMRFCASCGRRVAA